MPTPTTPTTLLEAVNTLLQGIRVASLATLSQADNSEDASSALQTLHLANREFQLQGWYFNTDKEERIIDPEVDGTVVLPANFLKVKSARSHDGTRLTARGNLLYDPKEHTSVITGTAKVILTVCLDFDDLPEAGRAYVTGLAARRFCLPKLPAQTTFQWTEEIVMAALNEMEREDADQRDTDLADTSPHFAKHRRR